MDKVLIRMIAGDNPVPEVIFVGFQDKSESLLSRLSSMRKVVIKGLKMRMVFIS